MSFNFAVWISVYINAARSCPSSRKRGVAKALEFWKEIGDQFRTHQAVYRLGPITDVVENNVSSLMDINARFSGFVHSSLSDQPLMKLDPGGTQNAQSNHQWENA
jgi:hypothetical protein